MRCRRGAAAVVAAVVVALAACTPDAPPVVSPSPSPSATQRSETPVEREQRVAYEAAEKAYRTSLQLTDALLAAGGAPSATTSLRAVATGPYLHDIEFFLKSYRNDKERTQGTTKVVKLQRRGYEPNELLLVACVDGRGVITLNESGKEVRRDEYVVSDVIARKTGDRWKIFRNEGRESKECPS